MDRSISRTGLKHRHGGDIVAVHAVGHETYKGVANWFFVGDVKWDDGSESKRTRISPICLGHDGSEAGIARCNGLHAELSDYLVQRGTWHDMKRARDGTHYSWTPTEQDGEQAVEAVPA